MGRRNAFYRRKSNREPLYADGRRDTLLGYYFMLGHCIACGKPFGFHPDRVPSLRIAGVREPVCEECVTRANVQRKATGLPLIVPLPGAYEPAAEDEAEESNPFANE